MYDTNIRILNDFFCNTGGICEIKLNTKLKLYRKYILIL